jgi:hypothetical protein
MLSEWEERLRLAAIATWKAMRSESERLRRAPTDEEIVVAALTMAYTGSQDAAIASPLGRFLELGCRIDGNPPNERDVACERTITAQATISIFEELAAPSPGSRFDPVKDKAVLDHAVKQYLRTGSVNNRAIGRAIGLSHVQVAERKKTRCARIMGLLRKEFPKFFQLHPPRRPKNYLYMAEAVSCGGPSRPHRKQTGPTFVAGS